LQNIALNIAEIFKNCKNKSCSVWRV